MSTTLPSIDELKIERPQQSRTRSPLVWLLLALVLLVMVLGGWLLARPRTVGIHTALAREELAPSTRTVLNASGYVVPRREATVSSKVTGKVVEVLVEEGMRVAEGQVLARLDTSNTVASLELALAQAELSRAGATETRVRLHEAEREFARAEALAAEGVAAVADRDRAEAEVKALQARLSLQAAEVAVADRQIAIWQQQLDDAIIRAPFAGVVVSKNAQPGEMISPMSAGGGFTRTGICTVVDMASLEIEVDVSESFINRVAAGQGVEATLDSYPDWRIPCKVLAVIPTADRQKATVKVRVAFNQLDPRILPQMGVKIAFRGNGDAAVAGRRILVPKSALRAEASQSVVFVVRRGQAERRAVTSQGIQGNDAVLASGIAAGEPVITDPPPALKEGTSVRLLKP